MKTLLKVAREKKGLKTREVAQLLGIDQALISKFESGSRKPTKEQVIKLASLLEIDLETIMIAWFKEKLLYEIGNDEYALKAMNIVREEVENNYGITKRLISNNLTTIINEIDALKAKLDTFRKLDSFKIAQALELEYTFESNRIEGNTLTLRETDLVINEGLTISKLSPGYAVDQRNLKESVLDISGMITDGVLSINLSYNSKIFIEKEVLEPNKELEFMPVMELDLNATSQYIDYTFWSQGTYYLRVVDGTRTKQVPFLTRP